MLANIKETILVEKWLQDDWKAEGFEAQILHKSNIHPHMFAGNLWKFRPPREHSPQCWQRSTQGFIKLNFDGASKGNPGQAGIGGVFRDSQGEVCRFYALDLGYATNTEAELASLQHGLIIAKSEQFHRLIV